MPLPRHAVLGRRSKRASARRKLREHLDEGTFQGSADLHYLETDVDEQDDDPHHSCDYCTPKPVAE